MSYPDRKPEIDLNLSKDDFNNLIEILSIGSTSNDEWLQKASIRLKDKIMEHTYVEDNRASIKFFPKEASDILYILFIFTKDYTPSENHFLIMEERFYEKHPNKKSQELGENK